MKSILSMALLILGYSKVFALGICGTDCEFAKELNLPNGGPAGGSYSRLMISNDLETGEYSSLIDLKACEAMPIDTYLNEQGNRTIARTYKGTGPEAFAYMISWKNLKGINISPELYKKLKNEFSPKRQFCFGSYETEDAWTSEYSNFVYSSDGNFFFAEIFGLGI